MTLLATSYCLTITYDRATFKVVRINHGEIMYKIYHAFSSQGVRTHPTHLVCLCHCYKNINVIMMSER